jgi:hypothetical protein
MSNEQNPPNPAPPLKGTTASDNPQENAAAYPTEPETPGANPDHTSEGVKKMKGREPYAVMKEEEPPKSGSIPGASK